MRYSDPALIDQLAAEYVLGTLAGGARRRLERLMTERADVRLAVANWERRLMPLANSVRPVNPPALVWQQIEQRTRPTAQIASETSSQPWWKPASWGLGGLVAGISLCAATLMLAPSLLFTADQIAMRSGERLPQSYVGVLTDAQGNGRLLVSSLRHGKTVTLKVLGSGDLGSAPAPLQLWALPPAEVNGGQPFLIATVPAKGSAQAQLPDTSEKLLSKVSKLSVNRINPSNPSLPGELVLSGNCAKLW
ncbi:MAG: hypothetical protein HC858_11050 [Brachymonas sp.]|nr:hypothetical protein [Brachymonas sp.]